jgi:Fe-Mn family superoxide dismutase
MTQYVLPDLPYDYGALEPHLSGTIMELHHDKHHRGYVEGANRTIEKLIAARRDEDFGQIAGLERALAFNVSGHVLHSIFWQNLSPDGGAEPSGELRHDIERDFGSFVLMKTQMVKAASTTMGSGWAALVWDPVSRRLGTTQIHDHQSQVTQAGIPLLVIDAWEHAYYLQYRTEKERYFEALWNLWDWDDVAERYDRAQAVDLMLDHVAEGVPAP